MAFVRDKNDLFLVGKQGQVHIQDYYTHTTWPLAVRLAKKLITPKAFQEQAAQAASFAYYQPAPGSTTLYHNQPINRHSIGVLDMQQPIQDHTLTRTGDDLLLQGGNTTQVALKNWHTSPEARKMVVSFPDATLTTCLLGCQPTVLADEFEAKQHTRTKRAIVDDVPVLSEPSTSSASRPSSLYGMMGGYLKGWYRYFTASYQGIDHPHAQGYSTNHDTNGFVSNHVSGSEHVLLYSYIAALYKKKYNILRNPNVSYMPRDTMHELTHQVYTALYKGKKKAWG